MTEVKRLSSNHPAKRRFVPKYPSVGSKKKESKYSWFLGWIIGLVMTILAILMMIYAAYNVGQLTEVERLGNYVICGKPLEEAKVNQVLDDAALCEEAYICVFWEQRKAQSIDNKILGRSAEVNVVIAQGDVSLIVPGVFLPEKAATKDRFCINGDQKSDKSIQTLASKSGGNNTCIIDVETALKLYGDTEVIGLDLRYDEEDFVVVGVVESARPLLLMRPTEQKVAAFDMLTVGNPMVAVTNTQKDFLAMRLNLDLAVMDFALLSDIARLVIWLPLLFLAGIYILYLLSQGFSKTLSVRHQMLFLLGAFVCSIMLGAFAERNIKLPQKMIASRFSDFALWQQVADETTGALRALFDAPVFAPTSVYYDFFFAAIMGSIFSFLLFLGVVWLLSRARFFNYAPKHIKRKRALS